MGKKEPRGWSGIKYSDTFHEWSKNATQLVDSGDCRLLIQSISRGEAVGMKVRKNDYIIY